MNFSIKNLTFLFCLSLAFGAAVALHPEDSFISQDTIVPEADFDEFSALVVSDSKKEDASCAEVPIVDLNAALEAQSIDGLPAACGACLMKQDNDGCGITFKDQDAMSPEDICDSVCDPKECTDPADEWDPTKDCKKCGECMRGLGSGVAPFAFLQHFLASGSGAGPAFPTPIPTSAAVSPAAPLPESTPSGNHGSHSTEAAHAASSSGECAPGCHSGWPGDKICDTQCNVAACGFDHGDCEGGSGINESPAAPLPANAGSATTTPYPPTSPDTHEADTHDDDDHGADIHGADTHEADTHDHDDHGHHDDDDHGADTHGADTHEADTTLEAVCDACKQKLEGCVHEAVEADHSDKALLQQPATGKRSKLAFFLQHPATGSGDSHGSEADLAEMHHILPYIQQCQEKLDSADKCATLDPMSCFHDTTEEAVCDACKQKLEGCVHEAVEADHSDEGVYVLS